MDSHHIIPRERIVGAPTIDTCGHKPLPDHEKPDVVPPAQKENTVIMSGYDLYNSDTELGRALRKHYPGKITDIEIHMNVSDPVKVVVTSFLPKEVAEATGWADVFGKLSEQSCSLRQEYSEGDHCANEVQYEQVKISITTNSAVKLFEALRMFANAAAENG